MAARPRARRPASRRPTLSRRPPYGARPILPRNAPNTTRPYPPARSSVAPPALRRGEPGRPLAPTSRPKPASVFRPLPPAKGAAAPASSAFQPFAAPTSTSKWKPPPVPPWDPSQNKPGIPKPPMPPTKPGPGAQPAPKKPPIYDPYRPLYGSYGQPLTAATPNKTGNPCAGDQVWDENKNICRAPVEELECCPTVLPPGIHCPTNWPPCPAEPGGGGGGCENCCPQGSGGCPPGVPMCSPECPPADPGCCPQGQVCGDPNMPPCPPPPPPPPPPGPCPGVPCPPGCNCDAQSGQCDCEGPKQGGLQQPNSGAKGEMWPDLAGEMWPDATSYGRAGGGLAPPQPPAPSPGPAGPSPYGPASTTGGHGTPPPAPPEPAEPTPPQAGPASTTGGYGQPAPAPPAPVAQPGQPPALGQQQPAPAAGPQRQVAASVKYPYIPSAAEMTKLPPGATIETPWGLVEPDANGEPRLVMNAQGQAAYQQARARAAADYGPTPFAIYPGAPKPNIAVGRKNFNPYTGMWS